MAELDVGQVPHGRAARDVRHAHRRAVAVAPAHVGRQEAQQIRYVSSRVARTLLRRLALLGGHGNGHKAHNDGKIYKCGACNQVLKQKLSPTEQIQQKTAAEEARLSQDIGAMNDDEFKKWSTGRG